MSVVVSTAVLGLAWFAAVNASLSLVSWTLSLLVDQRIVPSVGRSRLLLLLRFLPFLASTIIGLALFVPAHLALEPPKADERLGIVLLTFTAAGAFLVGGCCWRIGRLTIRSRQLTSAALRARATADAASWIELPLLHGIALAGVFRPTVLVGTAARQALTDDELEVALAHERAHQHVLDNLARAWMWCVPDFFRFTTAAHRLERLWDAQAECLADARAADGSPDRARRLASALLKIARLRTMDVRCPMAWSLLHQPELLETRVHLLLDRDPPRIRSHRSTGPCAAIVGSIVAVAWAAGLPQGLHFMTELLIASLP